MNSIKTIVDDTIILQVPIYIVNTQNTNIIKMQLNNKNTYQVLTTNIKYISNVS